MANIRLYQFPTKATPVAADIVYLGDSANSFDEVQSTIAQFANAIQSMSGLTGALASPTAIQDSSGNNLLAFSYAATPTDYFVIVNGAANAASFQILSSNTNASFSILAKGTGTVVIGTNGTTTIPLEIATASNLGFQFSIPTATALRTLAFPDANVTLVAGTQANAPVNSNITSMTGLTGYLASPLGFKDGSGNIALGLTYAATPTDYFQVTNGTNNQASVSIVSTQTNASATLYAKGSGGWLIAGGSTSTVPMVLGNTVNTFNFSIPAWTGNRVLTLPDGNVTLTAGTSLVSGGALGTPSSGTLTNCTGLPIAGTTGYGTGVATALAANVNGSGAIALTTSPTFVTPVLGAATATSLAFNPTTGGIIGTTTNDSAAAGKVGEFVSSSVSGAAVSLTTATGASVTSISLTAGDWDVYGALTYSLNASTVVAYLGGGASATNNTLPAANYYFLTSYTNVSGVAPTITIPRQRFSLSTTTTIYLIAFASFSVNTASAGGFIEARRVR